MIWKPKEKELTKEEAIALAKSELSSFWFRATPLIAGIRLDGKANVFPLQSDFDTKPWLFVFMDPVDFGTDSILVFAREWHKRYTPHGVGVLGVFNSPYYFLKTRSTTEKMISRSNIDFPAVIDHDQSIIDTFGVKVFPSIILYSKGKNLFQYNGNLGSAQIEQDLQNFLREGDPGLPLAPLFQTQQVFLKSAGRHEFGSNSSGIVHPASEGFSLIGRWEKDEEKITSSDNEAAITFHCPTPFLSIVAQTHSKSSETPTLMSVEIEGTPVYDAIAGENLILDETGEATVKISEPRLYHLLAQLPPNQRTLTFRFSNAASSPISIYGLRLGISTDS